MTALTSKDDFKQRNRKTSLLFYLHSCDGSVLTQNIKYKPLNLTLKTTQNLVPLSIRPNSCALYSLNRTDLFVTTTV